MSGTKNDQGKIQLSLNPTSALKLMAQVFMFGAAKYSKYNYRGGFDYSRLIDAAERHLHAFKDGEDNDPESGLSHLGHLMCCIAMLIDTIELGTSRDDRDKIEKYLKNSGIETRK